VAGFRYIQITVLLLLFIMIQKRMQLVSRYFIISFEIIMSMSSLK